MEVETVLFIVIWSVVIIACIWIVGIFMRDAGPRPVVTTPARSPASTTPASPPASPASPPASTRSPASTMSPASPAPASPPASTSRVPGGPRWSRATASRRLGRSPASTTSTRSPASTTPWPPTRGDLADFDDEEAEARTGFRVRTGAAVAGAAFHFLKFPDYVFPPTNPPDPDQPSSWFRDLSPFDMRRIFPPEGSIRAPYGRRRDNTYVAVVPPQRRNSDLPLPWTPPPPPLTLTFDEIY